MVVAKCLVIGDLLTKTKMSSNAASPMSVAGNTASSSGRGSAKSTSFVTELQTMMYVNKSNAKYVYHS
ncbi:hypothetical protein chiPu_0004038 [Chiloscyllium punctatum]|uniref:Uncharacterized protein n=1 Tax=Chiloscyllium punctatum TaxID=137246 RepID=A0A401S5G1_CHIPU|nr:hypothetical protein [Chiloscyllium punctatum]